MNKILEAILSDIKNLIKIDNPKEIYISKYSLSILFLHWKYLF
ncbi:conserved domain protein [Peptoniphilus sp. oral taxon 375 str. F0436]|nr:conserved domain protein [Peptoniphilus sp. oral taxon 375 str. F0436]